MKLNKLEFMLMNNPLRGFIQEYYETRILYKMCPCSPGHFDRVLEIGCGNGTGTRLIKRYFKPKHIVAIDMDERMVKIAQKNNNDTTVSFQVMDATRLDFPDCYFDGVFDYGMIHHIPNWRDCVNNLKRVMKPSGKLILEDLSIETFAKNVGRIWKSILDHPYDSMYTTEEFLEYLTENNFEIFKYQESNPFGLIRFFSLCAVNRKK